MTDFAYQGTYFSTGLEKLYKPILWVSVLMAAALKLYLVSLFRYVNVPLAANNSLKTTSIRTKSDNNGLDHVYIGAGAGQH
jgi:hypothetical protein